MERNPSWQRDELILALDLYFKHNPLHISKSHPEVVALSKVLNALPIHADRPDAKRRSTASGIVAYKDRDRVARALVDRLGG